MNKKPVLWSLASLVVLTAMLLSACGAPATTAAPATTQAPATTAAPAATQAPATAVATAAPTEAPVVIHAEGPFRGADETNFQAVVKAFEAANPGITIDYGGTDQFETVINVQIEAGATPDVAAVPQPGLVAKMAAEGAVLPLPDEIAALYDANYSPAWKALATINGKIYGVFSRVNGKGFVWYDKLSFEAKGYKVPTTWAELEALEQQMITDGTPPWCVTMESGAATGWVGTDWIENILLRTQPVDVYDKWVAHTLLFASPEVKNAWEIMDKHWGDPKMVYGGKAYIGTTVWNQAAKDLFAQPTKCWMMLQGNFITAFMPEDVQKDLDNRVGVFPLPMIDATLPKTLEVGGDQWVMFHDSPAIRKFMAFLASPASAEPWAKAGGALFPQKGQDITWYKSKIDQALVVSLVDVSSARFDGSDAMVSEGNVAFWKAVTDYVGGLSIDKALAEIDAAWPK